MNLDVQLDWPDGNHTAVELKYKTRLWVGDVSDEHFALKDQGANDIGGYDFIKDVPAFVKPECVRVGLPAVARGVPVRCQSAN